MNCSLAVTNNSSVYLLGQYTRFQVQSGFLCNKQFQENVDSMNKQADQHCTRR